MITGFNVNRYYTIIEIKETPIGDENSQYIPLRLHHLIEIKETPIGDENTINVGSTSFADPIEIKETPIGDENAY